MDRGTMKKVLEAIQQGNLSIEAAMGRFRHLPYESLDFATLDYHRDIRQGFPEVVFCAGKTDRQVLDILDKMDSAQQVVFATKVKPMLARKIQEAFHTAEYHLAARIMIVRRGETRRRMGHISVVTAGTSDIPIAEEAKLTAELLGYPVGTLYDVGVAGIHRLLSQMDVLEKGDVIIAIAGMDGALASVIGGLVGRPVIAVPTSTGYGTSFGGVSALLAMLNSCAAGLAVMNIDNGFGAAMLAHRILSNRV